MIKVQLTGQDILLHCHLALRGLNTKWIAVSNLCIKQAFIYIYLTSFNPPYCTNWLEAFHSVATVYHKTHHGRCQPAVSVFKCQQHGVYKWSFLFAHSRQNVNVKESIAYLICSVHLWCPRTAGGGSETTRTGWLVFFSPGPWTDPFLEHKKQTS